MSVFSTIDVGAAYRDLRGRITLLMADRTESEWEAVVPHSPEWTIRQTVAHLSGIVDDALNGNMAGVATDPWTAAQVSKREGIPGPSILEEWNTYGPFVDARSTEVGLQLAQLLFDATSHEQDLRFALQAPGGRDATSMMVATYFMVKNVTEKATALGAGSVGLFIDGIDVVAEIYGDRDSSGADLTLRASAFDFVRSFGSRRTIPQILALNWTGDPTALVQKALPFQVPAATLVE
jgi:hypothetical protein